MIQIENIKIKNFNKAKPQKSLRSLSNIDHILLKGF